MNPEVLALILSVCLGSADTQSCHKKFAACITDQRAAEIAAGKACEGNGSADFVAQCKREATAKEKMIPQIVAECM